MAWKPLPMNGLGCKICAYEVLTAKIMQLIRIFVLPFTLNSVYGKCTDLTCSMDAKVEDVLTLRAVIVHH